MLVESKSSLWFPRGLVSPFGLNGDTQKYDPRMRDANTEFRSSQVLQAMADPIYDVNFN